ncbi:MAG TPA: hypothetical protein VGH97_12360 [Thermoanaerobaculia bacterium]
MPIAAALILALVSSTPEPVDGFEALPGASCFGRLALDPSNPNVLFEYSFDPAELHRSDDGGVTWSKLTAPAPKLVSVVVSPTNSNTVYAVANGFYVSHDRGQTWEGSGDAPAGLNGRLIVDPFLPQQLYVASSPVPGGPLFGEIWFSPDEGIHWTPRDSGIPPGTPPRFLRPIVADPNRPGVFLVGVGPGMGVYMTSDGGDSWVLWSTDDVSPVGFEAGSSDVIWGKDDVESSPVVSMDAGRTWSRRRIASYPDPNPYVSLFLGDLVPDPVTPGVVYAIFIHSQPFLYQDDLLRYTPSTGWVSLRDGRTYPSAGFRDIAIHPAGPTVWVSACGDEPVTYRRGPRPTSERSPLLSRRVPRPTRDVPVRGDP